jgi:hypothetical protein
VEFLAGKARQLMVFLPEHPFAGNLVATEGKEA